MEFFHYDGGRSNSKRPKQRKDCVVRSVAVTARVSYDQAYDWAKHKLGRKSNKGCLLTSHLKAIENTDQQIFGCNVRPIEFKGTARELAVQGRFIVHTDGHVFSVVNEKVIDLGESSLDEQILGIWELIH